ncbi:long-chain acyl-CoA synthetase [Cetobacterium ceti]|uniref:Long-chain acyl-CoA synthetase n=1 Tax=Cetobacterium ceti TaxID=180163 RepID=A0A1T4K4K4_9FUSO|nr:AMP-binding protein [Cetobacterium ceti]SJZ37364.1 long-chain acyl-CoA synthetase [Cetobacterium ceti]
MEFIRDYKKTAIIYDGKEYSYSEMIKNAKGVVKNLDIKKEDKVVIFMENRPELLYTFLGTWDKNGTCVCLDGSLNGEELSYYLKDCTPKYIFTSENNYEASKKALDISEINCTIINVDKCKWDYNGDEETLKSPEREDVALMLYTSGTTGNPKGVMLTFDNILVNIEGLDKYKMYKDTDRVLALLPMHHIFPLLGSGIVPLSKGATIAFVKELSSQAMVDALNNYKITMMIGVPRLWEMLHKKIMEKINSSKATKKIFKLSERVNNISFSRIIFKKVHKGFGGHIRFFVSGGSKLDPQISRDFLTLGIDICEGYGLTETAPMISFTPIGAVVPGSAGKILPGVTVKIGDDGEILVKGRNVMKGYYNRPEATAEVIDNEGWFHTGDLGHLSGEYLFVTGRKKEMIVLSNGKNINPIEIEQWISSRTNLVEEIAVLEYEGLLTAVIYPNFQKIKEEGVTNIGETLKWGVVDKYNNGAPNYRKILDIRIVQEELPKTKIGKIRRFMIPDMLKNKKVEDVEVKEPDFEEYGIVRDYLKEAKGKEITPSAHLELDLGLDSLDMVEFVAFVEATFGVRLSENDLATNSTVEKIAEYIKEHSSGIELTNTNWSEILQQDERKFLPKSNTIGKIIRTLFKIPFNTYIKIKKSGIENIPKNKAVIFVGNHQSFLDGFIFNEAVPSDIQNKSLYLAKIAHFKKGLMKTLGENSNLVLVDINKKLSETLQCLATGIRDGKNIVIFPEGVRSRDGKMREFKKTFAIVAKETNTEVVPFGIRGAYELYPANAKRPRGGEVEIKFFEPIKTENLSYDEIINKSRSVIEKWVEKGNF